MSYTMFIGSIGSDPLTSPDVRYGQSSLTDNKVIIFDVVDSYNITLQNEKTQYPIESRSSVTDHIFSPDGKFSFVGRVMSSPMNIRTEYNEWDLDTNKENLKESQRAKRAYDVLVAARDAKTKVTLDFEEGVLTDYVITNLNMARDSSFDQLTINIDLEEMRTVTVGKTVLALNVGDSLKNDASGNKNKGAVSNDGKAKSQPCTTTNLNSRMKDYFEKKAADGDDRYKVCDETRYVFDPNK